MTPGDLFYLAVFAGLLAVAFIGGVIILIDLAVRWARQRRARHARIALLEARYEARRQLRPHAVDGVSLDHAAEYFNRRAAA